MGLLGVYDYTVVLTYIGTVVAFLGMGYAVDGGKMHIFTALVCLMISGFCDMFDGKIASTKKNRTPQQKKFGVQIDSLSDLVCFGVLPAIIVYQLKVGSKLEFAISAFYVIKISSSVQSKKRNESRIYKSISSVLYLVYPLLFRKAPIRTFLTIVITTYKKTWVLHSCPFHFEAYHSLCKKQTEQKHPRWSI